MMGNQSSSEHNGRADERKDIKSRSSRVPVDGTASVVMQETNEIDTTLSQPRGSPSLTNVFHGPSGPFSRPPRLPIPIEQEILSPGSPIISPTDISGPIDQPDLESEIPRKSSVLSSTTAEDEDGIDEGYRASNADSALPTVPTLVEWKEGGDAVYVTGTFAANWDKKFRLYSNGPSKDPSVLSALIPLPVGTHHLAFIVDNQMRTAIHMPTTVEWTNALVNYVEVTADKLPKVQSRDSPHLSQQRPASSEKRNAIGHQQQIIVSPHTPDSKSGTSSQSGSAAVPSTSRQPRKTASSIVAASATKRQSINRDYHVNIPRFLTDLDAPEDSSRYNRATAAIAAQPAPPSLPMFLNKSILNGATPMKDDSSVLIIPNHTVLNHLATSSIKNGVLATSATTRYKKKYVTTIMYKPTSEASS